MKSISFLIIALFFVLSCKENTKNKEQANSKTDSITIIPKKVEPAIVKVDDEKYPYGFYLINVSATANLDEATQQVQDLQAKGHPSGYVWLPDYESLSNKERYAVFIGPFRGIDTCIRYLESYQKEAPKAYTVKARHSKKRLTIHNKFDIRVNGKKQYMVLTYATPADSEEYAESGGEDWGWFVNEVAEYFDKYYPDDVYFASIYHSWFTEKDIAKLVEELDLEGFGYVLVKGKEKTFLPHDMSDGIISEACEFFGFEMNEHWQEEMNN